MAIIDMKKVLLVGMQSEKEKILRELQAMGNVEIVEIEDIQESEIEESSNLITQSENDGLLAQVEAQLAEIDFALNFIGKHNKEKKGLFTQRPEVDIDKLNQVLIRREEILEIAGRCRDLGDRINELRTQETRQLNIIAQMKPWEALDIPFEDLKDTAYTRVIAGTIDKGQAERFEKAIYSDLAFPIYLERLGEDGNNTYYFILYHKLWENEISEKFNEFGFSKGNFSGLQGTPLKIIQECHENLDGINKEYENIEQEAAGMVKYRDELELLYDALSIEKDRRLAAQKLFEMGHSFVLKGWIPAESTEIFEKSLSRITSNYYVEFEDPAPDEEFPVALRNSALVEPFETVTNLYSLPNCREIDPNKFMAPFYAMFFGIMLGDAAYGLILALVAYLATRKMKLRGEAGKLARLMVLCGISTIIWGALLGGWFGDLGTQLGIPTILFNPMEEPIKMLILCFSLGVLHVFAGMAVKAYIDIRQGNILNAVLDQGLWFVFYIGLILLGIGAAIGYDWLLQVGKIMAIGGAIGLILTQGRDKKNIIAKFFSGVLSLYNVTGFLSDVLSYSRLFALGLTTGVVGMVVNMLGGMLGTSWISWIFMAIIFAFGHLFNVAINVLGSFVHSSRLQYIEFYGKFYEGGGKAFKPLTFTTKYNIIKRGQ